MKNLLLITLLFVGVSLFSQTISPQQQNQIDLLVQKAENLKTEQKYSQAAEYYIKSGNLYKQVGLSQKAIEMFKSALEMLQTSQNINAKIQINTYIAYLYRNSGDYANAESYFKKAYELQKTSSDRKAAASALYNIAQMQFEQNKYQESVTSFDNALTIFLELNDWENAKQTSFKMAQVYQQMGNTEQYVKYYNLYTTFDKKIKDEIIRKKEQEAIIQTQIAKQKDMNLKLQVFKNKMIQDSLLATEQINKQKTAQIKLQELQLQQKQAELIHHEQLAKANRKAIIILAVGLGLIFLTSLVIFYLLLQNKKRRKEVETQNQLIEAQKAQLEKHNKQIQDSINYASRIQKAILPIQSQISASFDEHFIFYQPREVVSGDFYWYYENEDYKIISGIDCTGHSVPGAFVSMIANTLLNEIIKTRNVFNLDEVLNDLHKEVVSTLNKSSESEEISDGMDMTIFKFYKNERRAEFAAANQRAVLIVDEEVNILDGSIFSIGGYYGELDVEFESKKINLGKIAYVYMFSDGFSDQFNSEGKKFGSKNLIDIIVANYKLPLIEQQKLLINKFDEWSKDTKQIDDVLVIGLKV